MATALTATPDRTRLLRGAAVTGLAAAAFLLVAAAAAFACTSQATLHEITPSKALPGETVMVSGNQFGSNAVEIRWNTPDGVLLATAQGPSFNMSVQIPQDAASGPYYIVALAYDPTTGALDEQRAKGFEVLADESVTEPQPDPSTPPPAGSDPMTTPGADVTTNPEPAPESAIPPPATPDTAAPQIPAPEQPDTAPAPEEPATTTTSPVSAAPQPAQGQPATPDSTSQPAAPSPTDDPAPAASTQTSVETPSTAGDQPAGGDDAPAETAAPGATGEDEAAAPSRTVRPDTDALAESAAPSPRTGSGDLWSGLGTDEGGLSAGFDAPATARSGSTAGQVALAVGLLGTGLIVLVAAGTTLAVRRRRVRVGAQGAPDRDA